MRYAPILLAFLAVGLVSCDDIQKPTEPLSDPGPSLPLFQQADTTFAVDAGGRLKVNQIEGVVSIGAWDRAKMRVIADYDEEDRHLDIRQSGGTVHVSVKGKSGDPVYAELEITVPRGMVLEVAGGKLRVGSRGRLDGNEEREEGEE